MAAGRESLSASRVRVVPRRPFWAVPFNEKEFFYRSRVLRRAQKQAAAADWTGRCPVLVSSEEVAALANRCQQLEWAAAVAHYNVTQLHERVSLLEAAGEMPLSFSCSIPRSATRGAYCSGHVGASFSSISR